MARVRMDWGDRGCGHNNRGNWDHGSRVESEGAGRKKHCKACVNVGGNLY
ncbi:hypothetical protein PVK06_035242 [Gossypium arboreum]|uniref:Uncharacterized protein n=1 Tax=Gossypium arboreum TaxID=29729 RepID=A0ABR0NGA9_GOSAR|nr:hypothetical protein PVK06_035242 [Gossypium arboreum]